MTTDDVQLHRPMVAFEALTDLVAHLSLAASTQDIGHALLSVANSFHMTSALIIDATKLFDPSAPICVFATLGHETVESSRQPIAKHPITLRARASEHPFLLSSLREMSRPTDSDASQSLFSELLRHVDGIVVPIHRLGGLVWYASFSGPGADLSPRAQSVMSAAVHAGYALSCKLLGSEKHQNALSPREYECLRWVATGKTDFEVGKILSISPRTVRFHISNAKQKLGVTSRIQAVSRGASMTAAAIAPRRPSRRVPC